MKPDIGWDRMSSVDEEDGNVEAEADGVDRDERGGPSTAEEDDVEGQVPLPDDDETDEAGT